MQSEVSENNPKPTRKDLQDIVSEMIMQHTKLPPHVMMAPITQYDYYTLLMLMQTFLEVEG